MPNLGHSMPIGLFESLTNYKKFSSLIFLLIRTISTESYVYPTTILTRDSDGHMKTMANMFFPRCTTTGNPFWDFQLYLET